MKEPSRPFRAPKPKNRPYALEHMRKSFPGSPPPRRVPKLMDPIGPAPAPKRAPTGEWR